MSVQPKTAFAKVLAMVRRGSNSDHSITLERIQGRSNYFKQLGKVTSPTKHLNKAILCSAVISSIIEYRDYKYKLVPVVMLLLGELIYGFF